MKLAVALLEIGKKGMNFCFNDNKSCKTGTKIRVGRVSGNTPIKGLIYISLQHHKHLHVLKDFSLTVTLIFIYGRGSAISPAKQGNKGNEVLFIIW